MVSVIQENKLLYPILVYHKVDYKREFGASCVSPDKFRTQVRYLYENGYKSINISDLLEKKDYDDKYVCFMFDDAYECIYHYAYPVLREHDFIATLGVITDYIGLSNDWDIQIGNRFKHMNKEQISTLSADGWELASHSCSHKKLTNLDDASAFNELFESRKYLESVFGVPVKHLIYPYGKTNYRIISSAKEAGYTGASGFFTNNGFDKTFSVKRNAVYSFDSTRNLVNKMNHTLFENFKQRAVNFCSNGAIIVKSA